MKSFVVFVAVFGLTLAALSDEQRAKLKTYHEECSKESQVDQSLVEKAKAGEFTDDDGLKNHIFCVSKKLGFQNDAGEIQVGVVKEKLATVIDDPSKIDEIVKKCAVQKDTPQNTAFSTIECYYHAKHGN
ncbi:B2 protein [Aethina tumida]|uniref:B2 protein n=1 Tax=Aethina tumida TaxID=116153 RepID=UPI00096B43C5|nr:B2 protein [Aethina tumida]